MTNKVEIETYTIRHAEIPAGATWNKAYKLASNGEIVKVITGMTATKNYISAMKNHVGMFVEMNDSTIMGVGEFNFWAHSTLVRITKVGRA